MMWALAGVVTLAAVVLGAIWGKAVAYRREWEEWGDE